MLLVLAVGSSFSLDGIQQQAETARWPTVSGTILELDVPRVNAQSLLRYSYVVDGEQYEATRSCEKVAANIELVELVSDADVGDPIDVYFNPDKPEESVLIPGVKFASWFGLLCVIGSPGLLIYGSIKLWRSQRSQFDMRANIERQAQDNAGAHEPRVKRLRCVPIRMHPVLIACLTTLVYTLIFLGIAVAGDWGFQIWRLDWSVALAVSFSLAALAGIYDCWHTVSGNNRGRWDLVIDRQAGRIQLPATCAWSEPLWVNIDDVVGLSVELLRPRVRRQINHLAPYKLVLRFQQGEEHSIPVTNVTDRRELEVLFEWMADSIGIDELGTPPGVTTSQSSFEMAV